MGNMPNVELLDMKDVFHCCRVCGICSDAGAESVCGQALQAAVPGDCLHEVPLQRVCAPMCLQAFAIPALHVTQHESRCLLCCGERNGHGHMAIKVDGGFAASGERGQCRTS